MSAPTWAVIIRSILSDPFVQPASLLVDNLRQLVDSGHEPDNEQDRAILAATAEFAEANGHIPAIETLKKLVAQEIEGVQRIEELLMRVKSPLLRGDFTFALEDLAAARGDRETSDVYKDGAIIARSGLEVEGKRLRGKKDADEYVLSRLASEDEQSWPPTADFSGVDSSPLPPPPLDAVPPVMAEFVRGIAIETQTDPGMALLFCLGALAASAQRLHFLKVRGKWIEMLALHIAVVASPAERKSAVISLAWAPVYEWEVQATEVYTAELKEWSAMLTTLQAHAKGLKGEAAAEAEIAISAHEEAKPVEPRVIVDNCTQEKVVMTAATQGGSIAVVSAEGSGPFSLAAGRYASKGTSYEHLLSGHAGDAIIVDRVGRESLRLLRPSFTMVVAAQMDALRSLSAIPGARGMGLLARIIYGFPSSMVGRRLSRPAPVADSVCEAWSATLKKILNASRGLDTRAPLEFAPEALDVLIAFSEEIEPRLGDEGDLRGIADWGGKFVGLVARLSGLFAAFESTQLPATVVEASHVRRAVALAPWILAHATKAFGAGSADTVGGAAADILSWLRSHPGQVAKRDLHRALRGRSWLTKVGDLDAPLGRLVDHGWIRVRAPARVKKGRPGSPTIIPRPGLAVTTSVVAANTAPPILASGEVIDPMGNRHAAVAGVATGIEED